ncbi:AraC family transcriptional regulator [Paenibacillus lemnae]|uniref:AraC family transcriptional regulator n=2 Tax=Paenibacillus lemnae TaxID=1330551 RepID=A0A848M3T4_PAELE|nr:AraC family transcriptional regulator [Paenibacillus lemnae]
MSPSETLHWMEHYHCPPYITLAHVFHAPQGWNVENRILNQYALQYCIDGAAEYPVEDQHYLTQKGDLLFHRPGEVHSIHTVEGEPYVCASIVFHFGAEPFPFDSVFQNRHLLGRFEGHKLERMLNELIHYHRQPGLSAQLKCQGLLLQVLGESADPQRQSDHKERTNLAKMVLVKNHLIHHYPEDITHEDLEKISGLTRNYIILQFKQAFGMSPFQFLTWVRLQKAKELALMTSLSVGEIARQVGYSDVHTFGRMFKKKMGVSLTEYCSSLTTHYLNTKPRLSPEPEGSAASKEYEA